MAACDLTRPLTEAQRQAGFDQQRTGVGQALRPFSGSPTIENLLDYINRELVPVLRATRNAANDVWKQVVDNAPSANPLAFYFSTTTAAADPTAGRVRLNQAVQNTATVIRVSESNGRLQSVQPWLDVMSGGPTTPLGTVTLLDAINPGRFLRFDLNTMTDQGAYWDLGVTFIEGSDASPFVDDEAVTIGFIAGVSAAGSTVPVAGLSPILNDTFVGNVSGGVAPPSAVNLSTLAGAGLTFGTHTINAIAGAGGSLVVNANDIQRAALTGEVTAALDANATTITRSTSFAATGSTAWTGGHRFEALMELAGHTHLLSLSTQNTISGNLNNLNVAAVNVIRVTQDAGGPYSLTGMVASADGQLVLIENADSSTQLNIPNESASSTAANRFTTPGGVDYALPFRCAVWARYDGTTGRWYLASANVYLGNANTFTAANTFSSTIAFGQKVEFTGSLTPSTISSDQNNYNPTNWSTANFVRLSTNDAATRLLTGASAGATGEMKWLANLGPGVIRLNDEDASSTAANRFLTPGTSYGIASNGAVGIIYDGTSSRWRVLATT